MWPSCNQTLPCLKIFISSLYIACLSLISPFKPPLMVPHRHDATGPYWSHRSHRSHLFGLEVSHFCKGRCELPLGRWGTSYSNGWMKNNTCPMRIAGASQFLLNKPPFVNWDNHQILGGWMDAKHTWKHQAVVALLQLVRLSADFEPPMFNGDLKRPKSCWLMAP